MGVKGFITLSPGLALWH